MGNTPLHPIQKYISEAKNAKKALYASNNCFEVFNTHEISQKTTTRPFFCMQSTTGNSNGFLIV
jgi:hypothetical protein